MDQVAENNGYDPKSIEEKMKKLRFAKKSEEKKKDDDWFSKFQSTVSPKETIKTSTLSNGLTIE